MSDTLGAYVSGGGVVIISVPDVPEEVEIQLARSEFITSKLIDNTPGGGWGVMTI